MYMRLAGLLTRFHPSPSHWSKPTVALMMDAFFKAYSYGDSAGFTPSFPFHSFSGNQLKTKITKSTSNFV
jgi:hypothetical protein